VDRKWGQCNLEDRINDVRHPTRLYCTQGLGFSSMVRLQELPDLRLLALLEFQSDYSGLSPNRTATTAFPRQIPKDSAESIPLTTLHLQGITYTGSHHHGLREYPKQPQLGNQRPIASCESMVY
jgi:hypothetical protein